MVHLEDGKRARVASGKRVEPGPEQDVLTDTPCRSLGHDLFGNAAAERREHAGLREDRMVAVQAVEPEVGLRVRAEQGLG
jgi:hypothetical protein